MTEGEARGEFVGGEPTGSRERESRIQEKVLGHMCSGPAREDGQR